MSFSTRRLPGSITVAAAMLMAASSALAANTDTWVGSSGTDWNNAANWSPAALPATGDSLVFGLAGTSGTTLTDTLSGASFFGITFNSGASAYTMGGDAFTLTGGGITNSGTAAQIINQAITLSGANTVTTTAGGNITLGGAISGGSLSVAGSGTTILTGALGTTAVSVASGAILELSRSAAYSFVANQQFTGAGVLQFAGGAVVTIGNPGGTQINLSAGGVVDVENGDLNIGFAQATMATNQGGLYLGASGKVHNSDTAMQVDWLAGSGVLNNAYSVNTLAVTIGVDNTTNNATYGVTGNKATFSGTIGAPETYNGVAVSPVSVTKVGTGTQEFAGVGIRYTGATTLSNGTLELTNTTAWNSAVTFSTSNTPVLQLNAVAATDSWTLGNQISGANAGATVDKIGAGTVTLSNGANTYTGATTVSGGTLNVSGNLVSSITVSSGATLSGSGSTTGNLTLGNGSVIVGAAGTAAGTNGTAFTVGNLDVSAGGIVVSGTASATGVIDIVRYTGTLTGTYSTAFNLSAYRAPSAVTSVAAATGSKLQFTTTVLTDTWTGNSNTGTGTWDNSHSAGVWSNTGTGADNLFYSGDAVQFNDIGGQTTATVTIGAGVTPGSTTFNNSATNYTLQGSGGISGGSITKNGSGTLTIDNANTTNGLVTISSGVVNIAAGGSLGTGSIALDGGVVNIAQGSALGAGSLTFAGGTLNYTAATNDTLTASSMNLSGAAAIGITNASSNLTYAGVISGAGALTLSGPGTLTLSGANTYTGATTVASGMLNLTGSIVGTSAVTLGGSGTAGVLQVNQNQTLASLTTATGATGATVNFNPGTITITTNISGAITLNSALTVTQSNAFSNGWGQIAFSGITGNGAGAGNDSLILSNTSSDQLYFTANAGTYNFLGNVHVEGTTEVRLQGGNFLPTTASVIIDSGASLKENGGSATYTFDALSGGGTWTTINGGAQTLSMGNNNGGATFSGSIQGTTSVIKNGTGTQILSGANSYTGTTSVNAGTLLVNNTTGSGLGSGAVSVTGGTLGGTGTLTGGTITVANGATLQGGVGAGTGKLTIGGGVTLQTGSIIQLALGASGGDQLVRTGGVWAFDASQTFNLVNLGGVAGSYTLITGLTGSEAGLSTIATGWHNTSGLVGSFSYDGAGDVIFTAVPEPSTYGLIGAGALAAVAFVRRRRRKLAGVAA